MEGIDAWLQPEVIWFLIGLVLLVLEFAAPGLIIAFFGAGAWIVALICLIFDISLTIQLFIFLVTSIAMLVFLRKSLRRVFKLDAFDKNEPEDFIGKMATVQLKIAPNHPGKIDLNGTSWEAEADVDIAKGKTVRIIGRRSITFKVEPI